MVLLLIAILVAMTRRRAGAVAAGVLALGGVAFTLGMLSEPVTRLALTSGFDLVKTPIVALALVAAPATSVAALGDLRDRRKAGARINQAEVQGGHGGARSLR